MLCLSGAYPYLLIWSINVLLLLSNKLIVCSNSFAWLCVSRYSENAFCMNKIPEKSIACFLVQNASMTFELVVATYPILNPGVSDTLPTVCIATMLSVNVPFGSCSSNSISSAILWTDCMGVPLSLIAL